MTEYLPFRKTQRVTTKESKPIRMKKTGEYSMLKVAEIVGKIATTAVTIRTIKSAI
ncbi:MAG: hypothetical protein QXI32_03875 [Candidatus Bathyarchaeia archaeon]